MPDTNPDAVKLLSDDEVVEIEARANAATPRYCVDWEKGRHALLQDRGWRSASEEQPRTIATFDRENGYLDLLFCAEVRTDIPALCATVRALRESLRAAVASIKVNDQGQPLDRACPWTLDWYVTASAMLDGQSFDPQPQYEKGFEAGTAFAKSAIEDHLQSQLAQVT